MARYPEIVPDTSLVDRVVDLVDEGYDLAVRISRGGSPALVSRKLAPTRHVVCASPDYIARHGAPRRPEDLSRHACIAYTYSASFEEWRFFDKAGKGHVVAIRNIMHANDGDSAAAAASAAIGCVLRPTCAVR